METSGSIWIVIGAAALGFIAVAAVATWVMLQRKSRGERSRRASSAPPRRATAVASEDGDAFRGVTLGLADLPPGAVEAIPDRLPDVEENPDGGTLRIVATCPKHPERRISWTCPYCRTDFCEDCRRYTGKRHHCPSERCATRAANAT